MAISNTSTLYTTNGQTFSRSEYQGAIYQEVTFTDRLVFDTQFTITEPIAPSIYGNTVANYPVVPNKHFMGSFQGFWIHKIYNEGRLVMTVQGVDQEMFIPVIHDRVESVCMAASTLANGADCEPPDVPAPGALAVLGIAVFFAARKRHSR